MRVALFKFVTSSSMAVDITSATLQLNQAFGYSIQADYTTSGTLAGTFKLQCSVDHQQDANGNVTFAGNWVDIDGSSTTISAAGSFVWNVSSSMYPFVRLVYTHQSGDSGSLNAYFFERAF